MPHRRGMHRTGALTLTLVVTACAGGVTDPAASWLARRVRPAPPAELAHPAATFNQLQAISAVTNTPLFESFTVLAPRFTPASATGSVALALDFAARYSRWRRGDPPTAHRDVATPYPVLRHVVLTAGPPP